MKKIIIIIILYDKEMAKIFIHNQNTTYQLLINEKKQNFVLKRNRNFKDRFNNLKKRKFFISNQGYFEYRSESFESFFLNFSVDLVFVNLNENIIGLYPNFKNNQIGKHHPKTKFLYIFPEGTIKNYNLKNNDNIKHQRISKKNYRKIKYNRV